MSGSAEELEEKGWVIAPIVSFEVPEGKIVIPNTRTYEYNEEEKLVYEVWQVESPQEREQRVFMEEVNSIDEGSLQRYMMFYDNYTNIIAQALMEGVDIEPTIGYVTLATALSQLEDPQWTRQALLLDALWNNVVYAMGGTVRYTYDRLPHLEFKRQQYVQQQEELEQEELDPDPDPE